MSFCVCDTCAARYGCNQHQRAAMCRASVRAFTRNLDAPECADYVEPCHRGVPGVSPAPPHCGRTSR